MTISTLPILAMFSGRSRQSNPSHDLLQIPHARIHSLDPSGRMVTAPGAGHKRVGGKPGDRRNEAAPHAGPRTGRNSNVSSRWGSDESTSSKCWGAIASKEV